MPGRLDFSIDFRTNSAQRRPRGDDEALRLLVIADFSGNGGSTGTEALIDRPVRRIDIDNFDQLMRSYSPGIGTDAASRIEFRNLDDFHPDSLYNALKIFAELRDLRSRLLDPATFEAAATELLGDDAGSAEPVATAGKTGPAAKPDIFERLLGAPAGAAPGPAGRGRSAIGRLIADVVAPYVEPDIADRQTQLVASVDHSVGELMSLILHARPFQQLEARWRNLYGLISNFDSEEDARVFVFDATREELQADLAVGPLEQTQLYRRLVEKEQGTAGGKPWSMILLDQTFGRDAADIGLLAHLGGIAAYAGGPLLAAADLSLCGCASLVATPDAHDWATPAETLSAAWNELRAHPVARHIGLAAPRLLSRSPYGPGLDEIDVFDYRELGDAHEHEAYLWGKPCFAVGNLLAQAMLGGDGLLIDDLPMHVYERQGEREIQPCAEALISDRTAEIILNAGIMPLVSIRGRNAVQLLRLQSIADPATALD